MLHPRESYTRYLTTALVLTLLIIIVFQIYIWREPARIEADELRNKTAEIEAGAELFIGNCASCHGEGGEGVDAPALNDKRFLSDTADNRIFSVISSGVPSSEMPAWNQRFGGPFTDEQVRQITAFIRSWEPDAPDRQAEEVAGDPVNGLIIFESTCFACHGNAGQGTDLAPALNDPVRLSQFDDEWYADAIADGLPSKGMPTWGTVLSPVQINDLVALLRAWENGEDIQLPGPAERVSEALHMLEDGDTHSIEKVLISATRNATGDALEAIEEALEALDSEDMVAVEAALNRAADLLGMDDSGAGDHDEADDGHDEAGGEDAPADDGHDEATAEPDQNGG